MPNGYNGTACKTCRRRGRKCTKELPECHSCLNKGIQCDGYTLRWAGLASRGRLAGKTTLENTPQSSNLPRESVQISPYTGSEQVMPEHAELNSPGSPDNASDTVQEQAEVEALFIFPPDTTDSTVVDLSSGFVAEELFPEEQNVSYGSSQPALIPADLVFFTSPLDVYSVPFELKFILNYHLLEVAPKLCVDNTSVKNPYSQYILPLAVQKPPLLYACAALAACHLSVRLSDRDRLVDCLRFRGKAMRRLQEALWSEQSAKDEGNLGTVLMLTLTDMCLGGYSNFDAHFKAAKRLIDLRGDTRTQDAFVEQYIAWLDIMSAASNRRKPLFTSDDISTLTGPTQTWSHDVFPCPPDQFLIISDVARLYKSQEDPTDPTPVALSMAASYKTRLLMQPIHTERGISWMHLTEAYRHAIALYIIRLFDLETDEDEIAWLTQSVFYHAKNTPPLTGWADQLLWPLFHAALEIRDERRQSWLRERSQVMQISGGFGNVATAMAVLERVWKSDSPQPYLSLLSQGEYADMLVV